MITVAIHCNQVPWQREYAPRFKQGFERHGIRTFFTSQPDYVDADINMVFANNSYKPTVQFCQSNDKPLLTVNRCFFGSRHDMVAIGWDGFNGGADFCLQDDMPGDRWYQHGFQMLPWRFKDGYVLVCGEFRDTPKWNQRLLKDLAGLEVRYRPHPFKAKFNPHPTIWKPAPGEVQDDIETALAGASACVTLDSIAGCDAVLAGVPSIAYSPASMVWEVSCHSWGDYKSRGPLFDRMQWARNLAYCQWSHEEIKDGDFWTHLSVGAETRLKNG